MTMAKGIANGLPLGVTIATPEIADSLKALTISTFGGNPVSCAAANATIQIIEEENLAGNAERMGRLLRAGPRGAAAPLPEDDRRRARHGPDAGVELVEDETAGDRTPGEGADRPRLRGDEEARPPHRQGRPRRQRLPHLAGPDGRSPDIAEALAILRESFEAAGAR